MSRQCRKCKKVTNGEEFFCEDCKQTMEKRMKTLEFYDAADGEGSTLSIEGETQEALDKEVIGVLEAQAKEIAEQFRRIVELEAKVIEICAHETRVNGGCTACGDPSY